jgi:hypothetical protein
VEGSSSSETTNFESFVEAVDRLVTPAMLELGYLRIGAYRAEKARGSDEFAMGYEAYDEATRRRVMPDDPATADEAWLRLDPSTGLLNLSPVFAAVAGTDRAADRQHASASSDVSALLRAVGEALNQLRQYFEGG